MKISNFKRNSVLACALLAGLSGEMLGMFSSVSSSSSVPGGVPVKIKPQCDEKLRDACEKGDFELFQKNLKKMGDSKGYLFKLVVNSTNRNVNIFRLLVERGCKIKEATKKKISQCESIKTYIENIELFLKACKEGDLKRVKELEQTVGTLCEQENYKFSCLEEVASVGTALDWAAASGAVDLIEYMLDNIKSNEALYDKVDINTAVARAFKVATNNNQTGEKDKIIKDKIITAFIKNGFVFCNQYALIISHSSLPVVTYMVEELKLGIEDQVEYSSDTNKKTTLLGLAALKGRSDIVKYFVDQKNAKVNCNDNEGYENILELAIKGGNIDTVRYLLGKGAKLTTEFPLHSVVEKSDNVKLFELFMNQEKTAKEKVLFIRNGSNKTILHVAAIWDRIQLLSYLFEEKNGYKKTLTEALNKSDINGNTPLHLAATEDVAKILIENGAKIDVRNNNGQTPLQWAIIDQRRDVAKALIAKNADVNTVDNDGWTPLHHEAADGNVAVINLLIEHGASPHAKTWFLETPLSIAQNKKDNGLAVNLLAKHTNIWLYRFTSWLNDVALTAFGAFGTHALLHIDQKERPAYFKNLVLPSLFAVLGTHVLENVTRKNFSYTSYLQNEKTEKLACLMFGAIKNRFVTTKLGA